MGEITNSPNGGKSGVPKKSEHFLPRMWHPSRFTPKQLETSHISISEQTCLGIMLLQVIYTKTNRDHNQVEATYFTALPAV